MNSEEPLPMYLSAAEIAERIIKINARTLKRAQARGDIKGYLRGGKWRFETQSVTAWVKGKKASAEPIAPVAKRRPRGRPRKP